MCHDAKQGAWICSMRDGKTIRHTSMQTTHVQGRWTVQEAKGGSVAKLTRMSPLGEVFSRLWDATCADLAA